MILEYIKKTSALDLLAIVTPCLILIGFSSKLGFYSSPNIEALWVLTLFSPIDFMLSNLEIYGTYLLALIYLEKIIKGKENLKDGLFKSNLMLIGAFVGVYFAGTDSALNYYLFAASGLNGFAMLLFGKSYDLKFMGFLILVCIPFVDGMINGSKIDAKKLPYVELVEPIKNQKWYLLDKFSDKALLINKAKGINTFKIVELKDVQYIQSHMK